MQISSFKAVRLKGGKCPGAKRHFHGAAREVYGYLELLGQRHGRFVFPSIDSMVEHTRKSWVDERAAKFSRRQCHRIIKMFQLLCILGDRETRRIHGRSYSGWQMGGHEFWSHANGEICDFVHWDDLDEQRAAIMGNAHVAAEDSWGAWRAVCDNPSEALVSVRF